MNVPQLATAGVVAASWIVLGLASPAQAVCDAYSGGCPSTPPTAGPGTDIGGETEEPGSGTETPGTSNGGASGGASGGAGSGGTTSNPSTLPFTGGELVLMTAIGAGALAGGTALVVAGRRRSQSPA